MLYFFSATVCHLLAYILSRSPALALRWAFLIDKLHANNHTNCDKAHDLYTYETLHSHLPARQRLQAFTKELWGGAAADATGSSPSMDELFTLLANTQSAEQFHRLVHVCMSLILHVQG